MKFYNVIMLSGSLQHNNNSLERIIFLNSSTDVFTNVPESL